MNDTVTKVSLQTIAATSAGRVSKFSRQVVLSVLPPARITAMSLQALAASSPMRLETVTRQVIVSTRGGPDHWLGQATEGADTVW